MGDLFAGQVGTPAAIALVAVALVCTVTDLARGKIYNAVTYPAMLVGLALQLYLHAWHGVPLAVAGFAVGFFPALLMWALGGMEGGDVKLLGVVGVFAGPVPTTEVMVVALLFGTFIGFVKMAWDGVLLRSLWRMLRWMLGLVVPGVGRVSLAGDKPTKVRFGLAICLAVLAVLWELRTGGVLGMLFPA